MADAEPGPEDDDQVGSNAVLTVPNLISVVRLCCIPLFLWLLFDQEERAAAAVLLMVLGATDWVDGYLARRWNQVSNLGKILDPTADRLLLIVGIGAILIDGSVPVVIGVLALLREAIVALAALTLAALGARRIDVTWWGKTGTFLLMAAFPLFLLGNSDAAVADLALAVAWLCAVPGLVIAYYAAALYIPAAAEALREGRAGRALRSAAP